MPLLVAAHLEVDVAQALVAERLGEQARQGADLFVVVADDGAEAERLGELVLLAAAEDLDALELAVLVEQRRLRAVGVVGLLRPHLQRHRRVEQREVLDPDLVALVEVLVAVGGEGVGDARVHAGAEERELALLLELRGQRHLVEVGLVDGLAARLALCHVDVGGAALEARGHDRLVELGDDGVDDELAAFAGLGDGIGIGGVDELRQRLAVADLAGDERGALLVVVCDDDLGDGRIAAEVPGEDLALHAGADDKDLHRALPPRDRARAGAGTSSHRRGSTTSTVERQASTRRLSQNIRRIVANIACRTDG